jgi:hypothetical protein
VHPMTSPYLPLVALLAASTGDLVMVPSCSPQLTMMPQEISMPEESAQAAWEVPVQEMLGADGVLLSAVSVEVDGASPRPSDDTGGSFYDMVMCGTGLGMLGRAIPGDAILSPGLSGTVGLGVAGLALSSSLGFLLLSIDWRWVECDAKFTCLQVATAESLLHRMLTLVGQNLLHPILVSLKKRGMFACPPLASF